MPDFTREEIQKATKTSRNFEHADLAGIDLNGIDLSGSDLIADLSWANLRKVDLRGTDLSEATLLIADLTKFNLEYVHWIDYRLRLELRESDIKLLADTIDLSSDINQIQSSYLSDTQSMC